MFQTIWEEAMISISQGGRSFSKVIEGDLSKNMGGKGMSGATEK